jgi:hypothetical protein
MANDPAACHLAFMDVSEAWKYERDWKSLRRKPLDEILQMKFAGSEYWKELVRNGTQAAHFCSRRTH